MLSRFSIVFIAVFLLASCQERQARNPSVSGEAMSYKAPRAKMIEQQLVPRGIQDSLVLNAMREVPRHRFVPADLEASAYDDQPLPIGFDQTISQPYIVALMTEKLNLKGTEKVLEIGTGSGYQAAILSRIAAEVFTIEIVEPLVPKAKALFESLGYDNIHAKAGDGLKGWPDEAPFDAIIITAAPPRILEELFDQLKEGGRMVLPVGGENYQELMLVEKNNGQMSRKRLIPVRFVKMTGAIQKERQ